MGDWRELKLPRRYAAELMRTGTPSGSTSGVGAALTIMNTGSSRPSSVVLTELKREMPTQVEGPNIIYGVEIAPTAPAREGSSTWNLCSKNGR
jgi:hypothetical protein